MRTFALVMTLLLLVLFQVTFTLDRTVSLKENAEIPVSLVQRGHYVDHLDSCSVAFVVSVACHQCQRLAARISSASLQIEPLWVILEPPPAAEEFGSTHSLPRSSIFSIDIGQRLFARTLRVPLTPLRVILNRNLVVREISPIQTMPSVEELNTLCAG